MSYIYRITSPSNKIYIGQSRMTVSNKKSAYRRLEKSTDTHRKITNAIRKHGWNHMHFDVIEENALWTKEQLDSQEIYWIKFYDSVVSGYNISPGGKSNGSELMSQITKKYHTTLTTTQKRIRSQNCSIGQKLRFQNNPEEDITKERKSKAHQKSYLIESPDGRTWLTYIGLKDFAHQHKSEIGISYWSLFNAYRKCYNNTKTIANRKNINQWKVIEINESYIPDSTR